MVQAVKNEQKAKEVATAVDAVSEAARSIGSAQEDASALSGAALQAAAALSSLNGTAGDITGTQTGAEEQGLRQDAGDRQNRDRQQAESKSFALGATFSCLYFHIAIHDMEITAKTLRCVPVHVAISVLDCTTQQ